MSAPSLDSLKTACKHFRSDQVYLVLLVRATSSYIYVSSDPPLTNVFISTLGMHYLHSEAPVKVIHRDLKSRNGKGFDFWNVFVSNSSTFICIHTPLCIHSCFDFLSSLTVVVSGDKVLKVCFYYEFIHIWLHNER